MSKNAKPSAEDIALFKAAIGVVKRIKQDTVVHSPRKIPNKNKNENEIKRQYQQHDDTFYFSDHYQPLLQEDPIRYCRPDCDTYQLKKLRRGDYIPDFFLDLHGLTQQQAKQEIAALITACLNEHVDCACIMYGHGKHILKKQTPMWLAQHPNVLCFHQATKEYGGNAALLLLIDIDCDNKVNKIE
jgi:DNA-nicking Smr family endonuclease